MSLFESLSSEWLMAAGLIFVVPKLIFGALAVLLANAEKVPFLNRLMGDRVKGFKKGLQSSLRNNIRPFSRKRRGAESPTQRESDGSEPLNKS